MIRLLLCLLCLTLVACEEDDRVSAQEQMYQKYRLDHNCATPSMIEPYITEVHSTWRGQPYVTKYQMYRNIYTCNDGQTITVVVPGERL